MTIQVHNEYANLGKSFSLPTQPSQIKNPDLLLWNDALSEELGLTMNDKDKLLYFSGQRMFSNTEAVAMAYAGHQFGQFSPQLGDGRAHLLGEIQTNNGQLKDIHLKGSGITPFSRNGDGKCAIQPAVREYIMSEAMHALGIPTTRCLSVITTGEALFRQHPTTGAVVCRIADSHIRVGTFEYFAARQMHDEVKILADYYIKRHCPEIQSQSGNDYLQLLKYAINKQVKLVCEWLRVGFIHGVMNTDNTLLTGDTIDYGPCAMMGSYNPSKVFSSIDHNGRYAFGNQPQMAHWNMARLAESLIPLIDQDDQQAINLIMPVIGSFSDEFKRSYHQMMAAKLGFNDPEVISMSIIDELLKTMYQEEMDYTRTFNQLHDFLSKNEVSKSVPDSLLSWANQWLNKHREKSLDHSAALALMEQSNPLVIPRNHHVEDILTITEESKSAAAVIQYLEVLKSPYQSLKNTHKFQQPSPESDLNYQTFCGT